MATYIALLRGVNLAGHKMVAMADLRRLCESIGLDQPRTILQSGNLVFRSAARNPELVERRLEQAIVKRLNVSVAIFVRSAADWDRIVSRNPMRKESASDPSHLLILCLKSAPAPGAADALRAAIKGQEVVHVDGREAYMYYPDGVGQSKVTSALVEKKLGTIVTARNWNTVMKLQALVST